MVTAVAAAAAVAVAVAEEDVADGVNLGPVVEEFAGTLVTDDLASPFDA